MYFKFHSYAVLTAAFMAAACSGNDTPPEPVSPKRGFEITGPSAPVELTVASSAEVGFEITGPGASGLTAEAHTNTEGWTAEVTGLTESSGPVTSVTVTLTSPDVRSRTEVLLTVSGQGEIRSITVEAICSPSNTQEDDPYSTPDSEKTVAVKPIGGSTAALTASFEQEPSVKRYYFGLLKKSKVEEYHHRIGPEWKDYWRDQILEYLYSASFDYWDYEATIYRFEAGPDGEPLEPDTDYYIYVVPEMKNAEPAPLELTRISTLPRDERPMPELPAEHIAVEDATVYDATTVSLTPDATVASYYYNLIDQDYIDGYIELYGTRWDGGFLDKWDYYLTYEYSDRLSHEPETYTWTNLTPDRTYTLFVVYYDAAGSLSLELTEITTPHKKPVTGSPRVGVTQLEADESTATFRFSPNADCGKYTVDIWSEEDLELWKSKYAETFYQQLINYAERYGRVLQGEQSVTLDINDFYPMPTGYTRTWADNRYDLVILPFDRNGVYDEKGISYTHIGHSSPTVRTEPQPKAVRSGPRFLPEKTGRHPRPIFNLNL